MRRYNTVPLILLILPIINFALAAPLPTPEGEKVYVDVGHVPKDVITVLGKRGDELDKLAKLFDNFDRWWGDSEDWGYPPEDPGSSSALHPPSSSAPLESGQGSTQVHVPPANPASLTESDRDPESLVSHPSTPSSESVSDPSRETAGVDHGAPPPDPVIESEHRDAPPPGPGSDPNSAYTVGNLGESSDAPATSATDGVLRRGASMTLPGLSDYPKSREQPASRGSANPMDEDF